MILENITICIPENLTAKLRKDGTYKLTPKNETTFNVQTEEGLKIYTVYSDKPEEDIVKASKIALEEHNLNLSNFKREGDGDPNLYFDFEEAISFMRAGLTVEEFNSYTEGYEFTTIHPEGQTMEDMELDFYDDISHMNSNKYIDLWVETLNKIDPELNLSIKDQKDSPFKTACLQYY